MLRWLLILTMAFLPWHGWGASLGMGWSPGAARHADAPAQAAAHVHAADRAVTGSGQVSAECAGQPEQHAAAHADEGCPGCSMCHSCTPLGLVPVLSVPASDGYDRQPPVAGPALFASAERLGWLKPPIS